MAGARASISLTDVLIRLLDDHVPKEVAYQEALFQHTKGSKFYGEELEGDPPIWERTAWNTAVRWLARKSEFFHGIDPADSIDEDPIDTYERLLREYLTDVKGGGPTQRNPVAAELLEFDQQPLVAALCEELGDALPPDLKEELVSHADTTTQGNPASLEAQSTEEFVAALLAGPDDQELTPRHLARLEAYLKQPVSFAAVQQEKRATGESETWQLHNKLKLIRDFNRQLQQPLTHESGTTDATPKRRGRKADYSKAKREEKLAAEWRRARDAGVYKPHFARDHKMTVKDLDALLDRVAKRKERSDN
jgi:hypothetical protein